jgi:hypothetical protein
VRLGFGAVKVKLGEDRCRLQGEKTVWTLLKAIALTSRLAMSIGRGVPVRNSMKSAGAVYFGACGDWRWFAA